MIMGSGKPVDESRKRTFENKISRRGFIGALGAATAGTMLGSCQKKGATEPDPAPVNPNETGDVALAKLSDYDYDTLKSRLETMFTQIGGLDDVISSGDKVAIKINLTGGNSQATTMLRNYGCSAEDSIWTHSAVLQAVGELLIDAGAGKLYVVEGQSEEITRNVNLGYGFIINALGATYVDLNRTTPYSSFTALPVSDHYNFNQFTVNPILHPDNIDVYVTLPKMKCHYTAGITLSMKNNVGMVPDTAYGNPGYRVHLHGTDGNLSEASWFLPRTIVDLNLARPVDLAIIDGINTMDRGEGPWINDIIAPVNAKALVVSKDPMKADAVGMQVMGFDPLAGHYEDPFVASENWLLKAQEKALGDPDPEHIVVAGNLPGDFSYPFHPCTVNAAARVAAGVHPLAPYGGGRHFNQKHRV